MLLVRIRLWVLMENMQQPFFGSRIRVRDNAPYCRGQEGTVVYIGDGGISVAIDDLDIDYMIFNHGEYDVISTSLCDD